jgi:hypothetical protein
MHQSRRHDLAEVKAVLDRLQRISRRLYAGGAQEDASTPSLSPEPVKTGGSFLPASSLPIRVGSRIGSASWPVKAAILIMPVAVVAVFVGIERWSTSPPNAASNKLSASGQKPEAALHVASELMASGQIQAARTLLLGVTREESADVAWTLARSYDPNFLATMTAADAGADVVEATRWYRAWYDIAVKQGLVADSVSLERVIRSMSTQ